MEKTSTKSTQSTTEPTTAGLADRVQSFVRDPLRSLLGDVASTTGTLVPTGRVGTGRALAKQENVDDFLRQVRTTVAPRVGRGRMIFGMDATASREPTWKRACDIQAEMFRSTASIGGIEVQLVYYRGLVDMTASPWLRDADALLATMKAVRCQTGETQIRRILKHALKENAANRVSAVVFVGDCMEESADQLIQLATEAGVVRLPIFIFQEGDNATAKETFEEMARLSGGAYCAFDAKSAGQLKELLSAVAVYAAGGRKALADYARGRSGIVPLLTHQLDMAFQGL